MMLPREGVIAARDEEMKFMTEQLGTWVVMRRCDLPKDAKVISCRWIDHNKGDAENLVLRSRLVLQETKKVSSIADNIGATFSATPTLESLRLLLSLAMSLEPEDLGDELVLVFIDISRAHPNCDVLRDVCIVETELDSTSVCITQLCAPIANLSVGCLRKRN